MDFVCVVCLTGLLSLDWWNFENAHNTKRYGTCKVLVVTEIYLWTPKYLDTYNKRIKYSKTFQKQQKKLLPKK